MKKFLIGFGILISLGLAGCDQELAGSPIRDIGTDTLNTSGEVTAIADDTVVTGDIVDGTIVAADIATGAVATAEILDGTIANADISASAAIAHSKLASLTNGYLLVGSGSVATATQISGDVALADSGAVTIQSNAVENSMLNVPVLRAYQETFAFGDMTDGGGTSGTFDLSLSIPEGAVVTQVFIDAVTGFAGDTSAVITIGDGSTADRYNTGTPNVFATADHVSAGAVSGTAYHSAAKTPKVTITTNSDFTSVSAGQATITIFYYQSV